MSNSSTLPDRYRNPTPATDHPGVAWSVPLPNANGTSTPTLILACSYLAAEFKALERKEDGFGIPA